MFITDIQYLYCDLNLVFNLLNIEKLLSYDTDIIGCTSTTINSFIICFYKNN